MARRLALFDLDNTLLAGDSDHAWGEFLISKNLVDKSSHRAENDKYYQQYKAGKLDIHGYVRFTIGPILEMSETGRNQLHAEFMQEAISPLLQESALKLVNKHRENGDFTLIITATNEFITTPIARLFEVEKLIATELEIVAGNYTGNITGTPCYQAGKVEKLQHWLQVQNTDISLEDSIFYSDSFNDLPLLDKVGTPIVVDPDPMLEKTATERGWKIISLR